MSKLFPVVFLLFGLVFPVPAEAFTSYVSNPTELTVIYVAPKYGLTGPALSPQDVTAKFQNVIYARNQMSGNLPGYLSAGFAGKAMIYLVMDEFAGPAGLASVTAQKTLCTATQKQLKGYSNNPAMDTGDFCEIHDGIIHQTALPDYPDIVPTEGWFLHKADGSRFVKAGGADSLYRPNPNNPGWREYYARRALREMIGGQEVNSQGVITSHPAVAGVTGLFIDNVDLSWSKVLSENGGQPPKEYISNADYVNAVLGFVMNVRAKLHTATYVYPIWGNMISDPNTGSSWDPYAPYLDGGMNESFVLSWGKGPRSASSIMNELTQAAKWIGQDRHFLAVIQGDSNRSYMKFTLASFLLVTKGYNSSYFYANYAGSYGEFYEIPELYYQLGAPLDSRKQVTSSPLVYERAFQCGHVNVNFSTNTADIVLIPGCTPGPPTPTVKPGDANGDGKVDETDYGIWLSHFGQTVPGGASVGDFDGNGNVDGADYVLWLTHYGS